MKRQTLRVFLAISIFAAILSIASYGCSRGPDKALYMPRKPSADFLKACKIFKEPKGKNRSDESDAIDDFFQKCVDKRGREKKEGYIPITQKDLVNLIGKPEKPPFEGKMEWFYYIHFKPNGTGNSALIFGFENGYLVKYMTGAGD